MKYTIQLVFILSFLMMSNAYAQISGSTNVTVGSSVTYSYSRGSMVFSPLWNLANYRGTVNSQWQSGTTYYITITWANAGAETLAFFDGSMPLAQLNITVNAAPPPVPTPSTASNISYSGFTANWGPVSGATYYILYVSTNSGFTSHIPNYNGKTVSGTSEAINGLTGSTTYYYRLRSANASASSNLSTYTSATTTQPPPSPPTLTSATNVTSSSFTANWINASDATGYTVEVSPDPGFSSIISGTSGGSSASIIGLTGNTLYYVRVRASNAVGTSGPSNVLSFTTLPSPPNAQGASNVTNSSFTANWGSVSGATQYLLEVSENGFSSLVPGYDPLGTSSTSANVTGLAGGRTYSFRVRARNSGWTTDYSSPIDVLTIPSPPLIIQATNITNSSFNANWSTSEGATSYLVDLAWDSNFTQLVSGVVAYPVSGLTLPITGLPAGYEFFYRVRAVNGAGISNVSTNGYARLLPEKPVASLATGITATTFIANWGSVYSATGYYIDFADDINFSSGLNTQFSSSTSYTANANPGSTYYYRVRAVNPTGQSTSSDPIMVITVPPAPLTTNPSSVAATSFVANWIAANGAASYRLEVSTDINFGSFVTGYSNFSVTTNSASVTSLASGMTYYYRVRSVNSSGTSSYSAVKAALLVPPVPTPAVATNIGPTSFNANWIPSSFATSYRLDVSTVSTFTSFVTGYNGLVVNGSSSQNVSGLQTGKTYYYRVRAVNGAGSSVSSTNTTVSTLLNPPVATKATAITSTSFVANWNAATNATSYRVDVSSNSEFTTFFSTYNNVTVSGTSTTISGLIPKKTYYYRVRAVNATRTSVNSNTVIAVELDQNYVRTIDVTVPGKNTLALVESATVSERMTSMNFIDGLGRTMQSVIHQGSPGSLDVVQPIVYDLFGREAKKYLPYADENTGWYKGNAMRDPNSTGTEQAQYITGKQYAFYQPGGALPTDQNPYSETRFEASPLNRATEQGSPGAAWQPDAVNTWESTDRTVKSKYESNVASEVLKWSYVYPTAAYPLGLVDAGTSPTLTYYSANELYKTRTKDEQYNEVIEYKDKAGKVVLKRVQSTAGTPAINDTNYASTYYIYDGYDNLVCVIPPEATSQLATYYYQSGSTSATRNSFLARWAFRYTYDASRRMTQKHVPGAAAVYMIYDKRNRLVLTQDGNQRAGTTKYWSFTKYDVYNRPVATGITANSSTRSAIQLAVNNYYANLTASQAWFETYVGSAAGNVHGYDNKSYPQETVVNNYLKVNYYDSYAFRSLWTGTYTYVNESLDETVGSVTYTLPTAEHARVVGQLTGTKVKILDGGIVGGSNYLKSITYFDYKLRPVQVISDNQLGGTDRISTVIDFSGKVLESKTTHTTSIPTSRVVVRNMEYDNAGRLIRLWHKLDTESPVLVSKNDYNELGQLTDKKLHSTIAAATDAKQSVDFNYNIRGWLTKINNSDVSSIASGDAVRDHFGMELGYNLGIGTANTGVFNGNISGIKWSVNQGNSTIKEMGYNFSYDPMNRLLTAASLQNNAGWVPGQYDESVSSYDMNGNIRALQRKGLGGGTIDNLSYNYGSGTTAGNLLLYVQDNAAISVDKAKGFVDGNTGTNVDYSYDSLGNMTRDLNKGIGSNVNDASNLIAYNFLSLPETVTKSGNTIRYVYDANGRKLAQIVTSGTIQTRTDYVGDYVYENNTLQFVNHDEGRIVVASTKLVLTDAGKSLTTMTASNATLFDYDDTNTNEEYVRVTASSATARAGVTRIGNTINVIPNERYKIRIKGYRGTNPVYISVKTNSTTDLNWPGVALPGSLATESWVEQIVTVPGGASTLHVGVTWNTAVTSGDAFYINEFEVIQLTTTAPEYQYHLKDHLGNIRVTFTSRDETESATATLETANMNAEQAKFLRYQNVKRVQSTLFDRTNGASTGYAQRLNGSTNEKFGLARSISVMPGDKLNIEVYAKYVDTNNSGNWTTALANLMTQISNGAAGVVVDGSTYSTSTSSFPFPGIINTAGSTGGPKAYLNYILFDRNFGVKTSGYKRLSSTPQETGGDVDHERLFFDNLAITEPGYIYIFLSNEETTPVSVFFDDFKVEHIKSPIISAQDYYPFGLAFNSYKRENSVTNNHLFTGKEKQDELGLDWYDHGARMYDASIGRWMVSDPLSHKMRRWSPYAYAFDNPVRFIDPEGMAPYTYNWESKRYENEKGEEVQWSEVNQSLKDNGDLQTGMAIFVSFPDANPDIPSNQGLAQWGEKTFGDGDGKVNGAGHAGVVLINDKGETNYFDFGRYDRPDVKGRKRGKDEGAVRSSKNYRGLSIPNWDFGKSDNENMTAILTKLHKSPLLAGYGTIVGALAKNLNYGAMLGYARGAESEGYLPFGGYTGGYNYCNSATYCAKFARGVGAAGGFDWDWDTFTGLGNVGDVTEEYEVESITLPPKR
ncbi:DUF6695 family protein [Chryseolinea sp. T2]|uniref:fibronectin type III domain-containing protein n=1 Tax=Chryseolinea sp. T2 TaxID=3129255 RepID=UPI003078797B